MMTHHLKMTLRQNLTSYHQSLPLVVLAVLFVWLSHPLQRSESVLEPSSCLLAVTASPSQLSFWPWLDPTDGPKCFTTGRCDYQQYTMIIHAPEDALQNTRGAG